MNKGVEILIERMKTNPEDFDHDGKFADTARRIREEISGSYGDKQPWFTRHLLTEAEWEKLRDAFIEMSRDKFTESVMKNLLKDKEEPRKVYPQGAGFGLSTGTSASLIANPNAGTLTLNNGSGQSVTLTPEMVEYLEDRVKEYKNGGAF
jgi:hypothetical protein